MLKCYSLILEGSKSVAAGAVGYILEYSTVLYCLSLFIMYYLLQHIYLKVSNKGITCSLETRFWYTLFQICILFLVGSISYFLKNFILTFPVAGGMLRWSVNLSMTFIFLFFFFYLFIYLFKRKE